jgi:8-oxo-dGTP pyrophosphatase MutT (NUDIX family)
VTPVPDYITWLRRRVGHDEVFLNFAAACVVRHGRLLLQRRGDDGSWGLPGGALELGESAAEAVAREVQEETGLRIRIDGLLGVYTKYRHRYPNGDVAQPITTVFRCTPEGDTGAGADGETLELRYFPLSDVPELMNRQHDDAVADLRAGRSGVYR